MTIKFGENQTVENKSLTITDNFTLGGALNANERISGEDLTFHTDLIHTDGANVGIGTTTLSEKLDVSGRIKGDNLSVGTDNVYTDGTNVGIGTTTPTKILEVSGGQVLLNNGLRVVGDIYGTDNLLLNQDVLALGDIDINNGLFLTRNSNVGISNANPSEKLEVSGNIKTSGDLLLDGALSLGTNYGTFGQVLTSQGTNPLVWQDAAGSGGGGTEIVATRNLITSALGAGANLTSGAVNNIVLGDGAGNSLVGHDGNVMIGYRAGRSTANNNNIAIGYQSAGGNTNLNYSLAIGHYAGER